MPVFYFSVSNSSVIADTEGTDLADVQAARCHAHAVARELMYRRRAMLGHPWNEWTMIVTNDQGSKVLSFRLADADEARP